MELLDYEELGSEPKEMTGQELFIAFWTSPRKAMEYINTTKYNRFFYPLLYLVGVDRVISRMSIKEDETLPAYLLNCFLGIGALGFIYFILLAFVTAFTGKVLGGIGKTKDLLRIMVYSMVPSLIALGMFLFFIVLNGREILVQEVGFLNGSSVDLSAISILSFIQVFFGFWSSIILIIGISVAHNFSILISIINLILVTMVIFILVLIFFRINYGYWLI